MYILGIAELLKQQTMFKIALHFVFKNVFLGAVTAHRPTTRRLTTHRLTTGRQQNSSTQLVDNQNSSTGVSRARQGPP